MTGKKREMRKLTPAEEFCFYQEIYGEKNYEKEGSEITFFMGCLVSKEMKDVVISLFDKLGIDVTVIGGCCGYPIEKIGRRVKIKLIEKEMDKLIFSCPNGMLAFKEFKPMHISQFILSLDVNFLKNNKNYIYHDSSFLGRYLGIYDEPRILLQKAGKFLEFDENKEIAKCCGSDLAFSTAFPEMAEKMAEKIVEEARKKNAVIVTASPHCYSHLKKYGEVMDIAEVIKKCLNSG